MGRGESNVEMRFRCFNVQEQQNENSNEYEL